MLSWAWLDSLNQPRGNLTGVSATLSALGPKHLELLHEMLPSARTVVLLVNADNPSARANEPEIQAAAHALGQRLEVLKRVPMASLSWRSRLWLSGELAHSS